MAHFEHEDWMREWGSLILFFALAFLCYIPGEVGGHVRLVIDLAGPKKRACKSGSPY